MNYARNGKKKALADTAIDVYLLMENRNSIGKSLLTPKKISHSHLLINQNQWLLVLQHPLKLPLKGHKKLCNR